MIEKMGKFVQTLTCKADLRVRKSSEYENKIRLEIEAPILQNAPLILPVKRDDFHPFIRPFDKIMRWKGMNAGSVTFILLYLKERQELLVPLSLALGGEKCAVPNSQLGGRHLMIFPGWGSGTLWNGPDPSSDNVCGSLAHHITVQADDISGDISSHITSSRTLDGKPVWRSKKPKRIRLSHGSEQLIGTFLVKEPGAFKGAGTFWTYFDNDKRNDIRGIEDRMAGSLSPLHPVIEMPEESSWNDNDHLQIHLILTPAGRLEDRDYPIAIVKNPKLFESSIEIPDQIMHRIFKYEILKSANLILAFAIVPGRLKHDFYWL